MITFWVKNLIKKLNVFFVQSISCFRNVEYMIVQVSKLFSLGNLKSREYAVGHTKQIFNEKLHRFFLLNQVGVGVDFISLVFKFTNSLNYILNPRSFLWYYSNTRLNANLKNTEFYRNVTLNFNGNRDGVSMYNSFLVGFRSVWLSLRFWVVPVYLGLASLLFMSYTRLISFHIFFVKAIILFGIFYWLLSGFTFFLKKYQYRYFTSALQRFWKRSYAIFWMLEFFTLTVFVYLTLMASQEPFLMYDNVQFFKTHLFSWRLFLLKIFLLTTVIFLTYFLIINTKWSIVSKSDLAIMFITFLLIYISWVEFYQFFHVVSYYGNYVWKMSEDTTHWILEGEFRRTRITNHFVTICLIAKFWHIVFTIVFWLFFIVRGLEVSKLRYPLLVANFQNFVFIYILTWVYMYPWVKFVVLKLFNTPYYWMFVNTKKNVLFILNNDVWLYLNVFLWDLISLTPRAASTLFDYKWSLDSSFYYLHESSTDTSFTGYRKNYIRDLFVAQVVT